MATLNYYASLPDELQAIAFSCEAWLRQNGFVVKREITNLEHPALATITCKRNGEIHLVLVRSSLDLRELETWVSYGRSCTKSTSIAFCIPARANVAAAKIAKASALNCGLYVVSPDRSVQQTISAGDLSFSPSLPELSGTRASVRKLIAPAHQAFKNGQWKQGFEDACKVTEDCARNYLLIAQKSGRAEIIEGSKLKQLTKKDIKRLPLGALADMFCKLRSQNATEAFLCNALKRINPARILTIHKGQTAGAREKLKWDVGRHMWVIHNILEKVV